MLTSRRRYSQYRFFLQSLWPKWSDWNVTWTRRGKIARALRTSIVGATFTFVFLLAYRAKRTGISPFEFSKRQNRIVFNAIKNAGREIYAGMAQLIADVSW